MKICLVGGELLRAVGQTDMTQLVVTSRSCFKAPNIIYIYKLYIYIIYILYIIYIYIYIYNIVVRYSIQESDI